MRLDILIRFTHTTRRIVIHCSSHILDLTSLQPHYGWCAKRTYENFVCFYYYR